MSWHAVVALGCVFCSWVLFKYSKWPENVAKQEANLIRTPNLPSLLSVVLAVVVSRPTVPLLATSLSGCENSVCYNLRLLGNCLISLISNILHVLTYSKLLSLRFTNFEIYFELSGVRTNW